MRMRGFLKIGALAVLIGIPLQAATLQRLSLEEMIQKSTSIVRGRVTGGYTAPYGGIIYTHHTIQVSERWKGKETATEDVVTPGGVAGGIRQTFPGAPAPVMGTEYVLFLWTSPSGLTHIIGLSQGLLSLSKDADGQLIASRPAIGELMLDSTGRPVKDDPVRLTLGDLKKRIAARRAQGATK